MWCNIFILCISASLVFIDVHILLMKNNINKNKISNYNFTLAENSDLKILSSRDMITYTSCLILNTKEDIFIRYIDMRLQPLINNYKVSMSSLENCVTTKMYETQTFKDPVNPNLTSLIMTDVNHVLIPQQTYTNIICNSHLNLISAEIYYDEICTDDSNVKSLIYEI